MNLYYLTRQDEIGYDEYDKKVVRAESEHEARVISNINVGDEGCIWEDPAKVDCIDITNDIMVGVILASFRAG